MSLYNRELQGFFFLLINQPFQMTWILSAKYTIVNLFRPTLCIAFLWDSLDPNYNRKNESPYINISGKGR